MKNHQVKKLIVAGGVAANRGLRESLTTECQKEGINLTFPPMKYCTDNAAMIATAGYYAYQKGDRADLSLNAKSSVPLS